MLVLLLLHQRDMPHGVIKMIILGVQEPVCMEILRLLPITALVTVVLVVRVVVLVVAAEVVVMPRVVLVGPQLIPGAVPGALGEGGEMEGQVSLPCSILPNPVSTMVVAEGVHRLEVQVVKKQVEVMDRVVVVVVPQEVFTSKRRLILL